MVYALILILFLFISPLMAQNATITVDRESLQSIANALNDKVNDLKNRIDDNNKAISQLQNDLDTKQSEINALTQEQYDTQAIINSYSQQVDNALTNNVSNGTNWTDISSLTQ